MTDITTCLWFADAAEEAARTYCAIVPDSRIRQVMQRDDGGGVLFVSFELAGRPHLALNGNPGPHFNGAVSLAVTCDTQAEVDRIWDALLEGGKPIQCGWLTDRFGVAWQVVPRMLMEMWKSDDAALRARVMAAMVKMVKLDAAVLQAAADGR